MKIEGAILFPLKVGKSQIHGQGAFATQKIPAKKKIGNLGGIIISKIEGRKKQGSKKQ